MTIANPNAAVGKFFVGGIVPSIIDFVIIGG